MVVLDPSLEESAIEALNTRIQNMVTQRGGTIDRVDNWGRRRLAYPIGRLRDGGYILGRLQLPPHAAGGVERALKLTESAIPHLLVPGEDLPAAATPTVAAPAGARE